MLNDERRTVEESYTSATNSSNLRREREPVWAADTRRKLLALGLWPKGVPVPDD